MSWFTATMGTEGRAKHAVGDVPSGEKAEGETKKQKERVSGFEEWFADKGGVLSYATPRGLENKNDEGEAEGLFASEDIGEDDVIMSMPLSHIMCAST